MRANREIAEFGQRIFFQLVVKYHKTSKLDVRWQWGFFFTVATRPNEIMLSWTPRERESAGVQIARGQTLGC